jgi:hypothetical protein
VAVRFGHQNVFMDVDTIQPGDEFRSAIVRAVASCDVLLALIGPAWASVSDNVGRRRLDIPEDFVVLEISTALYREAVVIPVLIDGAEMPDVADLPQPIASLATRNAITLDHESFASDVEKLLRAIEHALQARWRPVDKAIPDSPQNLKVNESNYGTAPAPGARVGHGSIVGDNNTQNTKTHVSTGGILVAIVAVIALIVVSVIVGKNVAGGVNTNAYPQRSQDGTVTPTNVADADGIVCPGTIRASSLAATDNVLVDNIGDACGSMGSPIADLESVSYSVQTSSISFVASFAGTLTGKEMASIEMASTAEAVDDDCSRTSVSLDFYPEGSGAVYTGCRSQGTLKAIASVAYERAGNRLTWTVPKRLLPSRQVLYMRAAASTGLRVTSSAKYSTPISDYLPDRNVSAAPMTL